MFCGQCGRNLPDDVRFCQSCGRPTAPASTPASFTNATAAAAAPALSSSPAPVQTAASSPLGAAVAPAKQKWSRHSIMIEQQNQSPTLATETVADSVLAPTYFAVSPLKLVVMSTCTLGLYEIYWYYKHWCSVKEREKSDITPLGRAFFAFIFCYSLFKRIQATGQSHNIPRTIAPGPLAAGFILLSVLYKLPDPYWLLSFFAVLFLVPVQMAANEINLATSPKHDRNSTLSKWNLVVVVIGGLCFALALVATFLPSK
jgi:hypothetical protein